MCGHCCQRIHALYPLLPPPDPPVMSFGSLPHPTLAAGVPHLILPYQVLTCKRDAHQDVLQVCPNYCVWLVVDDVATISWVGDVRVPLGRTTFLPGMVRQGAPTSLDYLVHTIGSRGFDKLEHAVARLGPKGVLPSAGPLCLVTDRSTITVKSIRPRLTHN